MSTSATYSPEVLATTDLIIAGNELLVSAGYLSGTGKLPPRKMEVVRKALNNALDGAGALGSRDTG